MDTDSTPAEPVAETAAHTSEKHFEELKHEIRLATRSSRYALATAVAAALVSAGVAAWASVHVTNTQDSMTAMAKTEAAVKIVGSDRGPIPDDLDTAQLALFQGPTSLLPAIQYAHDHDPLVDDARWTAVSGPAVAAIDKFVGNNSIDHLAEHARADLGAG